MHTNRCQPLNLPCRRHVFRQPACAGMTTFMMPSANTTRSRPYAGRRAGKRIKRHGTAARPVYQHRTPGECKNGGADLQIDWQLVPSPYGSVLVANTASQMQARALGALQHRPRQPLALHIKGTFQLKVWQALLNIPHGQLSDYGTLARRIGHTNACRATNLYQQTPRAETPSRFLPPHFLNQPQQVVAHDRLDVGVAVAEAGEAVADIVQSGGADVFAA